MQHVVLVHLSPLFPPVLLNVPLMLSAIAVLPLLGPDPDAVLVDAHVVASAMLEV